MEIAGTVTVKRINVADRTEEELMARSLYVLTKADKHAMMPIVRQI
jgi:hypothetical protein